MSADDLKARLRACDRNVYRLQVGGNKLCEALRQIAGGCVDPKNVARQALDRKEPDPDFDRIATLEAEVERLREALRPFALAADAVEKHDPTFPEHGACLRASFDWFVRVPDSDGVPDFVRKSATRADLCRARATLKDTDHTNQENSDAE